MSEPALKKVEPRRVGQNIWISSSDVLPPPDPRSGRFEYSVLQGEAEVGQAMFDELVAYSQEKEGDIVIVLLGGLGAQGMYRVSRETSVSGEIDGLLSRLHVFTQDALAPMRMSNGLSFVRDFERLLGPEFFAKIKSFTPFVTETDEI